MRLLTLAHGLQRFFGRQSRASAQVPLTVKRAPMLSTAYPRCVSITAFDTHDEPRSTPEVRTAREELSD
jgi:hypothetical protein